MLQNLKERLERKKVLSLSLPSLSCSFCFRGFASLHTQNNVGHMYQNKDVEIRNSGPGGAKALTSMSKNLFRDQRSFSWSIRCPKSDGLFS